MNYFDDEKKIIESFQEIECSTVFFPLESDIAISIFKSIHDTNEWLQWTSSAGKADPPPDYYCEASQYMMDVMRVDDHTYKNKKGKLVNPTNIKESKIQTKLIEKGIPEMFPNVDKVIVNAVTDLPTHEDHNYKYYKKNFVRIIKEHIKKIELYRSNHPDYKLVFFVFDESSGYIQLKEEIKQRKITYPRDIFCGIPHLCFWDEDFLNIIIESDIDFLIWYSPFKLLNTEYGYLDLPHVCIYDVKSINIETIKYNENCMVSFES